MKIELTKDEVGTLLKVLEDYKEVLLKRIAQESKNGSFSNANGKRSFIYKFIIPLKVKLIDMMEGK